MPLGGGRFNGRGALSSLPPLKEYGRKKIPSQALPHGPQALRQEDARILHELAPQGQAPGPESFHILVPSPKPRAICQLCGKDIQKLTKHMSTHCKNKP